MKCVLLSGGGGLRLWPLSRRNYPKQFLSLGAERSLFEEAITRNEGIFDDFMILTNAAYLFMTEAELEKFPGMDARIVLEGAARNTAPAIAIASLLSDPEEILFVAPTDALIKGKDEYHEALESARSLAAEDNLVTFGIRPTSAHTGYGYIECDGTVVKSFKEKPDAKTAESYVATGNYLWNSGMFMFKSRVFLEELARYRYDIYDACKSFVDSLPDRVADHVQLPEEGMLTIPSESIDYAVIEKSNRVRVVPSDFYWNDMGNLEELVKTLPSDTSANHVVDAPTILSDCENVSVINENCGSLVVANDLQDIEIVNTSNAVFVTRHGSSQKIKQIISDNDDTYAAFFDENIQTYRPWGNYEVLISAPHYKVKRITVNPGKQLSLQLHNHRSEHWTVAKGTVLVTLGQETVECKANQSAYIPIGVKHRLSNPTDEEVEIIEVSIGEYIGEDDIERFEDDFGRA